MCWTAARAPSPPCCIRLSAPRGIKKAAILALDGTGNPELARHVFGKHLRHEEVRIERDAYVTGTHRRGYSRSPSQGRDRNGNLIEGKAEEAKRLQKELHTIASRLPGPVLWVGAKRVVGERGRDVGALSLPDDFDDRAHYGKLRGLNEWEHCTSVLAIGRESVSVATLEGIARAFLTRDPKPLIPLLGHDPEDGDAAPKYGWCKVTRMRRMRDGSLSPVEVEVHPDPRVQMVFEQMRESELIQGIDRVRPIFNRRWIALLNNLCLDVTYDRVLTHREMVAGGSRMEIAYQATGILPMGARDLHALSAKFGLGLFQTEDAAKRALKVGRSSNKRTLYLESDPLSYRLKNQRGSPSWALVDRRCHPDPHVALEAALGPLEWVRPSDAGPVDGLSEDEL